MNELFQLGLQLRSRYVNSLKLVSSVYTPKEIYIRSTDINRTLISAQSFAAGFFSSGGTPGKDFPNLSSWPTNFIPVPVHTDPISDEQISTFYTSCLRKEELWEKLESESFYQELVNESAPFIEEINNQTNQNLSFFDALGVMNHIVVEKALGLSIVSWAVPLVDDFSRIFSSYMGALLGFGDSDSSSKIDIQKELSILLTGNLLNSFTDKLVQRTNCEGSNSTDNYCDVMKNQKFYGYSGHDLTLMALFKGLGFNNSNGDEDAIPGFGSCVLLELWQNKNFNPDTDDPLKSHYLKILYIKDPTQNISSTSSTTTPSTSSALLDLGGLLGCPNSRCTMDFISKRAEEIRPDPELMELCEIPLSSGQISQKRLTVILLVTFIVKIL